MCREAGQKLEEPRGSCLASGHAPRSRRDALRRKRSVALLIGSVALSAVGCADACESLSSQVCERLGPGDATCVAIRNQTERPRPGDGPACEVALAFAHELQRSR